MSENAKVQIHYFDAGTANGGTQLQEASEAYFTECLASNQGHVVFCRAGDITAITGTRYMSKPIGYLRDGAEVVIVNGDGGEMRRYDDVSWVVGTPAGS